MAVNSKFICNFATLKLITEKGILWKKDSL